MDRYTALVTLLSICMALHVVALWFSFKATGALGELSAVSLPRVRIAAVLTAVAVVHCAATLVMFRVGTAMLLVSLFIFFTRYVRYRKLRVQLHC